MASLGKCLLFYLKYPAEMERLFEPEEPKVEGLPDPDQVLEKVKLVGKAANREVADFLEACAPRVEEHFRPISTIERVRTNLESSWGLKFRLAPKKAADRRFEIGVFIDASRAAVIPWIWCRGGRRAEDEVIRILRAGIKSASLEWASGMVGLKEIKIPVPERFEEPVEYDSLVAQVQQAFAILGAEEVKAICAITPNRGEP
jgi:hypothetical protein